ncbi:MAG: PDZ domain-containing protein [Bacteroidota bacterium]
MKKQLFSLLSLAMLAGFTANAQDDKKAPKAKTEKKEITINSESGDDGKKTIVIQKKKNGKDDKMVIVVDGDKVTINGKPAKDFEGKMDFFNHDDFDFDTDVNVHVAPNAMGHGLARLKNLRGFHGNKAMLGVTTDKSDKGAKVTDVTEGSAADKAGLKEGDVIVSINSDKINEENDLVELIGKYKPDESVDVLVLRDGKEQKLNAKLGKNDSPMAFAWNGNDNFKFRMPAMPRMAELPRTPRAFNFSEDNWPMIAMSGDKPKYGISIADNEDGDGVKITDVKEESNAAKAGIKEGDLVTEVNGSKVKNTDELKKQLADSKDKTDIAMKIMRNGSSQNITMKVPKKIKTADL